MICNRKTKPVFTQEQIAECHLCKHASGKIKWCCLLGCKIAENNKGKILVPSRKLLSPKLLSIRNSIRKQFLEKQKSGFEKYPSTINKRLNNSLKNTIPPTDEQIRKDYELVAAGIARKGNSAILVDIAEYYKRRKICIECNGGYRCPHYCCGIQAKLATKRWVCKEGKF